MVPHRAPNLRNASPFSKKKSPSYLVAWATTGWRRLLFGSDATFDYSAKYSWGANQLCHLLMGGVLGSGALSVAFALLLGMMSSEAAAYWAASIGGWSALLWLVFPPLKEAIDLLLDWAAEPGLFPVPWRDLCWDAAADVLFWSIGIGLGWALNHQNQMVFLCSLGVGGIISILLTRRFMQEKGALDDSDLPRYLRLFRFTSSGTGQSFDAAAACRLSEFLDRSVRARHLVISGRLSIGKTDLAIAVASEFTARREQAGYSSAPKIEELYVECGKFPASLMRTISVAVIDDVQIPDPRIESRPWIYKLTDKLNASASLAVWVVATTREQPYGGDHLVAFLTGTCKVPAERIFHVTGVPHVTGAPATDAKHSTPREAKAVEWHSV